MMVETMLESPQDLGMMSSLPQWKREILQRRAARASAPNRVFPPSNVTPEPSTPPAPVEDIEELRYGPGIVKKLKSRYLSLALREAPKRRPSVLRRATSLEHLLDEPTPQPAVPAVQPPPTQRRTAQSQRYHPTRRESIKRARSVDALSRWESREDEKPPIPSPAPRTTRVPRRPAPLLSDSERPPPDVVRSALRKFEPTAPKRPAPAARVSGVLRGLESRNSATRNSVVASTQTTPSLRRPCGRPPTVPRPISPRCSTPEPATRTPSPACAELSAITPLDAMLDETDDASPPKRISRAALEGIAQAGLSIKFNFESANCGSHLPVVAATNSVLLGRVRNPSVSPRQVGIIRPMPVQNSFDGSSNVEDKNSENNICSERDKLLQSRTSKREVLSEMKKVEVNVSDVSVSESFTAVVIREINKEVGEEQTVTESRVINGCDRENKLIDKIKRLNLQSNVSISNPKFDKQLKSEVKDVCEISDTTPKEFRENGDVLKPEQAPVISASPLTNGFKPQPRRSPASDTSATTMVFNFSSRKEVPDYIENDGMIMRSSKKDKFKVGDPGIVILKSPEKSSDSGSDSDSDSWLTNNGPPSPCDVKFINDNILINGKSSMAARASNKDRTAKLKLQFDDSLTRTFEYPSEASLSEDRSPMTPNNAATLNSNTHLVSASLSSYQPSKINMESTFQLGVNRCEKIIDVKVNGDSKDNKSADEVLDDEEYLKPCADEDGNKWSSETGRGAADLLF